MRTRKKMLWRACRADGQRACFINIVTPYRNGRDDSKGERLTRLAGCLGKTLTPEAAEEDKGEDSGQAERREDAGEPVTAARARTFAESAHDWRAG
jgi:hypothetical protein